jgi:hypothetical protein
MQTWFDALLVVAFALTGAAVLLLAYAAFFL